MLYNPYKETESEVKKCVQVCTAEKWKNHASNPASLVPQPGSDIPSSPLGYANGVRFYHQYY